MTSPASRAPGRTSPLVNEGGIALALDREAGMSGGRLLSRFPPVADA
ncbi:hypothetical protein [Streptomyces sp. NPDC017260]